MALKRKRSKSSYKPRKRTRYVRRRRWKRYKTRVKKAMFGIAETKRFQSPVVQPYALGIVNNPERKQWISCGLLQPIWEGDKSFQREGSSIFLRGIKFQIQFYQDRTYYPQNHRLVLFWSPVRSSTNDLSGNPQFYYNSGDFGSLLLDGSSNEDYTHFITPYNPKKIKVVKMWNIKHGMPNVSGGTDPGPPADFATYNHGYNSIFRRYLKINKKITWDENDASEATQWLKGWQLYLGYIFDGGSASDTVGVHMKYTVYYKDF